MSKNNDRIKKRMGQSKEFKKAYEEEQIKFEIADFVFQMRQETGLNQTKFAERVNKSRSTIARIENASMEPSISLLKDIAHALNKTLEIKVESTDKKKENTVVKL